MLAHNVEHRMVSYCGAIDGERSIAAIASENPANFAFCATTKKIKLPTGAVPSVVAIRWT